MTGVLCPVVVGRDAELRSLADSLSSALGGTGQCVFVTGEAGIGKTRLVQEIVAQAAARGATVAVGRAVPSGANMPYRPLTEALLQVLRGRPFPDDGGLTPWLPALASIVPGVGAASHGTDASAPVKGEAVIQLLRRLAPPTGIVLVLEDLHWSDPDTVAVVEYLGANLAAERVLCLVTVRSESGSPALALARRQRALLGMAHIPLPRLDEQDTAAMVRACQPETGADIVAHVLRTAEGVPLLVEELLASPGVPSSFADTVRERLSEFIPEQRAVIDAAAVLGRHFDWQLLGPASGAAPEQVSLALTHGVELLLVSVDGSSFRFRHALTREAVLDALLPPRRQELAAAALEAAERQHPGLDGGWRDVAANLAVLAGDQAKAADLLTASGRAALDRGALATASETLQRAAELGGGQDPALAPDRLLVEALALAGRLDEAESAGGDLITRLRARGADASAADVHLMLAHAAATASRWPAMAEHITSARTLLGTAPPDGVAARIAVLEAEAVVAADDPAEASRSADLALSAADAEPGTRCHALEIIGRIERRRDLAAARAAFERALRTAEAASLPFWRLRALHELGTIDMYDHAGTERLLAARRSASELGALSTRAILDLQLTGAFAARWAVGEIAAHAEAGAQLAGQLGLTEVRALALCSLAHSRAMNADIIAMEQILARTKSVAPQDEVVEAFSWGGRAIAAVVAADLSGATELLSRAAVILSGLPQAPPAAFRGLWPVLLAATGDPRAEAAVAEAGRLGVGAFRLNQGMLGYASAILAGRANDPRRAGELAVAAAAGFVNCDVWAALVRALAAALARADGWGDPERWLTGASAIFSAHGLHRLATWCDTRLARGGPVGAGGAYAAGSGVTAREAEVLALVGQGLANKQIATRLKISPRTVEKHVEALLRKTSATSRTQLAVLAAAPSDAPGAGRNTWPHTWPAT